jgi:hypothetical protein
MAAGLDRDQKLGADTVGRGHQHRVLVAGSLEVEECAEAAECRVCAGSPGGGRQRLDRLDQGIASVDIDARVLVGPAVVDAILAATKLRYAAARPPTRRTYCIWFSLQ